jgi:hypothetical protein
MRAFGEDGTLRYPIYGTWTRGGAQESVSTEVGAPLSHLSRSCLFTLDLLLGVLLVSTSVRYGYTVRRIHWMLPSSAIPR